MFTMNLINVNYFKCLHLQEHSVYELQYVQFSKCTNSPRRVVDVKNTELGEQ